MFDIGEKDGAPYLVMELMEGETLMERIERGPLPVDEMVTCAVAVVNALSIIGISAPINRRKSGVRRGKCVQPRTSVSKSVPSSAR